MIERAWCPECRQRIEVLDRHSESHYEGGSGGAVEQHYAVEDLACGHTNQHDRGTTDTAPGNPYAGGYFPLSATTLPRDLRAATEAFRLRIEEES